MSDGEEAGPSKAKVKPATTVGKGGIVSARRAQFERPPELNFAIMNSQKNSQKKLKDRMRVSFQVRVFVCLFLILSIVSLRRPQPRMR